MPNNSREDCTNKWVGLATVNVLPNFFQNTQR